MLHGSIELIIGCMYSGKSTEIQRLIKRRRVIGDNVMVIKHSSDTRYDDGSKISTHDKQLISCYSTHDLTFMDSEEPSDLKECFEKSDVIVIEEAQFFKDLFKYATYSADVKNKHLIIAGLDGDFNREPFGDIVRLIPQAEKVTKLSALCIICSDGTLANFSKRISASKNKIVVGSTNDYIAVCRGCYFKE